MATASTEDNEGRTALPPRKWLLVVATFRPEHVQVIQATSKLEWTTGGAARLHFVLFARRYVASNGNASTAARNAPVEVYSLEELEEVLQSSPAYVLLGIHQTAYPLTSVKVRVGDWWLLRDASGSVQRTKTEPALLAAAAAAAPPPLSLPAASSCSPSRWRQIAIEGDGDETLYLAECMPCPEGDDFALSTLQLALNRAYADPAFAAALWKRQLPMASVLVAGTRVAAVAGYLRAHALHSGLLAPMLAGLGDAHPSCMVSCLVPLCAVIEAQATRGNWEVVAACMRLGSKWTVDCLPTHDTAPCPAYGQRMLRCIHRVWDEAMGTVAQAEALDWLQQVCVACLPRLNDNTLPPATKKAAASLLTQVLKHVLNTVYEGRHFEGVLSMAATLFAVAGGASSLHCQVVAHFSEGLLNLAAETLAGPDSGLTRMVISLILDLSGATCCTRQLSRGIDKAMLKLHAAYRRTARDYSLDSAYSKVRAWYSLRHVTDADRVAFRRTQAWLGKLSVDPANDRAIWYTEEGMQFSALQRDLRYVACSGMCGDCSSGGAVEAARAGTHAALAEVEQATGKTAPTADTTSVD